MDHVFEFRDGTGTGFGVMYNRPEQKWRADGILYEALGFNANGLG